jgi:hypothetical protein
VETVLVALRNQSLCGDAHTAAAMRGISWVPEASHGLRRTS